MPVVPATLIHRICTGASVLGSDFICNLSFERSLGKPQVRARGALGVFWPHVGVGAFLALKTGGFLCAPLAVC